MGSGNARRDGIVVTWRDLHYDDPEERKKRDEHATGVMMKMVKYGHY